MIVCPNCNHQNPEGAVQCEACYTPLPSMMECPNCSASVQSDASFCGQCGFNLKAAAPATPAQEPASPPPPVPAGITPPDPEIPDLVAPDPLVQPEALSASVPPPVTPASVEEMGSAEASSPPPPVPVSAPTPAPVATASPISTQLQTQSAQLLHIQTNTTLELPSHLTIIHIGKPNDRIPPDIDVSGFADSEIVSRVHADIRVEGDAYYIEDMGSSNGTYVNNMSLPPGNRHRLRSGDRVGLGKGDKVSFIFQLE
ncbi:MAG: FHA domain-containing protein [Leptolyngbyaceae bacterium]|nr:FHA domain-containing protein [Leptolyngbyaceae bacterium]